MKLIDHPASATYSQDTAADAYAVAVADAAAGGMTARDRPRDLDDVIQLVRANALPREFGDGLDP